MVAVEAAMLKNTPNAVVEEVDPGPQSTSSHSSRDVAPSFPPTEIHQCLDNPRSHAPQYVSACTFFIHDVASSCIGLC